MTDDKDTIATIHAPGPPPVTVDLQDPLPESSWLYRRILSYALAIIFAGLMFYLVNVLHGILAVAVDKIDTLDSPDLKDILIAVFRLVEVVIQSTFLFLSLVLTYYMIAPSAEQLTKMIQTASILKGKISLPVAEPQDRGIPPMAWDMGMPPPPSQDDSEIDAAPRG